jgi:hypothetical protein
MDEIIYELSVYSQDSSNIDLLHQNIENLERYSTPSRLVLLWVKLKNNRLKWGAVQMQQLRKVAQKKAVTNEI